MLFKEAIQNFEAYLLSKDYADATIKGYIKKLDCFNRWLEENYNCLVYLDDISKEDLESYLLHLKQKGNKAVSRNRTSCIFKTFFKYAAKKGLAKNIAIDLELVKTRKKERSYLTIEEINEVINEFEKPLMRIVTIFLFNTGTRISEALNLKIEDVDFKNNIIHIKQAKGNKDRDIALSSKLKRELKDYLANDRVEVESKNLFATQRTGSLSAFYYNERLKKAVKRAGIDKKITAHCIRHSTAVAMVKKGVDLPTIQKVLGHENLKTTSIYVHSDMSQMKEALEII